MINMWTFFLKDASTVYQTGHMYINFGKIEKAAREYIYIYATRLSDIDTNTKDEPIIHINTSITKLKYLIIRVNPEYAESINAEIMVSSELEGQYTTSLGCINYVPSIINNINPSYTHTKKFINNTVSYQLLRANPKLTGNVKVVVTSDNNMYLDTFKVSDALSQYKYRHIKINPSEYYGMDLMTYFASLTNTDFYTVKNTCYNMFTTAQKYSEQYYDVYNSGVRTNSDKLYSENFALLAPLCIKETLPDFFLIFKVNTNNYYPATLSEADKIKYFFKYGKLIKSYDMRLGSNIGTYIRNIYKNAAAYPGDLFVSYDDNNYNNIIGISVEYGVITKAYESVFEEHNINNQVALNDFYTLGFERNKIVSKDIINLEYMFNDIDEPLFSLNTYFGVYVKLNGESDDFCCIGQTENNEYQFDASIHNFTNPSIGEWLDKDASCGTYIYGLSTPTQFIRLNSPLITNDINKDYMLKPYKNILTCTAFIDKKLMYKSYILFNTTELFDPGEHFKIIDVNEQIIYEVICTNYNTNPTNIISPVTTNYYYNVNSKTTWTIKSISIYTPYKKSIVNIETKLLEETNLLVSAINQFDSTNIWAQNNNNTVSITSTNNNVIFEHILSESGYNDDQKKALQNISENASLLYFNKYALEPLFLDDSINWENSEYFYLWPIHFESLKSRIATACEFISLPISNGTPYVVSSNNLSVLNNYRTVLYEDSDSSLYKIYNPYKFKYFTYTAKEDSINIDNNNSIDIPYLPSSKLNNTYYININEPTLRNSNIIFYQPYYLNVGLCSIFNIKDFNFDVLDSSNSIQDKNIDNIIGTPGEYNNKSVFDKHILQIDEEDIKDYLDKNKVYRDSSTIDLDRNIILQTFYNKNHLNSDISLIAPYCCKWQSNGTDARGENMQIMYNFANLLDTSSYYIPYFSDKTHNDYCTKIGYITNTSTGFNKYINYSINDLIKSSKEDSSTGIFNKNYIIYNNGHLDDILYNTYNNKNKESDVYISGDNTIEFISGGIKFKISSSNDDVINFNNYIGFTASFITVDDINLSHSTASELIIDEINKQILLIWYQQYTNKQSNPYIYQIFHTSSMQYCKVVSAYYDNEKYYNPTLKTIADSSIILDKSQSISDAQMFMLSNNFFNGEITYSELSNTILQSDIDINKFNDTSNYYTTINPVIHYGQIYNDATASSATNALINQYTSNYYDTNQLFIASDTSISGIEDINIQYNILKNTINNCGVFVKKLIGGKDYTKLSNLININIVPAFVCTRKDNLYNNVTSGYVHSTYITPIMKNMLEFDYDVDDEICKVFKRNLNGANISINNIKTINQVWFNKYTIDTEYCIQKNKNTENLVYRTSLDLIHNVSLMNNCWDTNMYHKYYIDSSNQETYESLYGYIVGCETNTFINSRGLVLHNKDEQYININIWKNSKISSKDKYIKLNITDSLVYYILFKPGYIKNWEKLNINDSAYKINYIKNCILPHININSYNKITIYADINTSGLTISDLPSNLDNINIINNCKNNLSYENGKYYMYIYPDLSCTYYANLEIKLYE